MRVWPCLLLALSAAACTPDYPMDKPGTWRPSAEMNANDANLRAMVVDPNDLVAGTGESTSLGAESALPVSRLLSGHRQPLPRFSSSEINVPTEQQTQTPGGNNNAGQ